MDVVTILIFTEGTMLGPENILGLYFHARYAPIGGCVGKVRSWADQGAEIVYITSRKSEKQVGVIRSLLEKYGFPGTRLYYRESGEKYKDVVERIRPDILIEDDCRSIGGKWQMCITHVEPEMKSKIKSVVVKEFKGIDHLPDDLPDLLVYNESKKSPPR
jgi:hypothetical protein